MLTKAQLFFWACALLCVNSIGLSQDSLVVDTAMVVSSKMLGSGTYIASADSMEVPEEKPEVVIGDPDSLWVSFLESQHEAIFELCEPDSMLVELPATSAQFRKGFEMMDNLSPLNLGYNPYIDSYINEYLKYKRQLSKLLGLSKLYFPEIEEILDKNNIPLEIRSLCVVESALNPNARSYRGATGLWQFMLPTGKECGLEINSYVDQRKSPKAATEAACVYLNRLYKIYGVWELAIAAYNCGPGNVNKAIRLSGGSKNFWEIRSYLPRETQKYVPRFMAMCYLMEYGELHGARPLEIKHSYWLTDTVQVKDQVRFDQIAEFTDISIEDLAYLNPQFKLGIVPASEEGRTIVIPAGKSLDYNENRDKFKDFKPSKKTPIIAPKHKETYAKNGPKKTYTVKNGDVLGTIAERHGVSVNQIKSWNGIGTRIKAGQKLALYPSTGEKQKSKTVSNDSNQRTETGPYTMHTVRKGDTLWDIAKLYSGVSSDDIKRLNRGINPNNLKMGSQLRIKKI